MFPDISKLHETVNGYPYGPLAVEVPDEDDRLRKGEQHIRSIIFMPGLTCTDAYYHNDSGRLVIGYADYVGNVYGRQCFQNQWGPVSGPSLALKVRADAGLTDVDPEIIIHASPIYRTIARILLQMYQITGERNYVKLARTVAIEQYNTPHDAKIRIMAILDYLKIEKYAGPVQFRAALEKLYQKTYRMRNEAMALRFLLFNNVPMLEEEHQDAIANMHLRITSKKTPLTAKQRKYLIAIEGRCIAYRMSLTQEAAAEICHLCFTEN